MVKTHKVANNVNIYGKYMCGKWGNLMKEWGYYTNGHHKVYLWD